MNFCAVELRVSMGSSDAARVAFVVRVFEMKTETTAQPTTLTHCQAASLLKPPATTKGIRAHRGDLHANVAGKISGACARASAAGVSHTSCWSANCACDCHKSGH